jgi:hypothetical protein
MYLTATKSRLVLSFAGIANPSQSRKRTKGGVVRELFLSRKKGPFLDSRRF